MHQINYGMLMYVCIINYTYERTLTERCRRISPYQSVLEWEVGLSGHDCTEFHSLCIHWKCGDE